MTALLEPIGAETVVATNGADPVPVLLSSGDYALSWFDTLQQNTQVAAFHADGTQVGTTYSMTAAINDHAMAPLTTGGFVVEYTTNSQAFAQMFDASGSLVGPPILLGSIDPYSTWTMGLAQLSGGGFAASWRDGNTITVRTYDASGSPDATLVPEIGTAGAAPRMAQLEDGTIALFWEEHDTASTLPEDYQVSGQLFSPSGTALTSAFVVNQNQEGSNFNPNVTALVDGGFVVTWVADGGVNPGVMAQVYFPGGDRYGANIHVSDTTSAFQSASSISALPWGGFLVAWTDRSLESFGIGYAIRAQMFDQVGAPVGDAFQVNAQLQGDHLHASVLPLSETEAAIFYRATNGAEPSGLIERVIALPTVVTGFSQVVSGSSGDDRIAGLGFDTIVHGGDGNDALQGGNFGSELYGDDGNDILHGGSAIDILDGGAGADIMIGGAGGDTYVVDDPGDIVRETDGRGPNSFDTVLSSISFSLVGPLFFAGSSNIERIILTGSADLSATGDNSANILVGNAGANSLLGNDGDDIISGMENADVLTGGLGADTFYDTTTGLNGDTITDFSADDRIVISDAAMTGFTFNVTGHTLTYTGGSLTLTNLPVGSIVAHAAAGGGIELSVSPLLASTGRTGDFNGDGRADILWRNGSGEIVDWLGQANGGFAGNAASFNNADNSWHVVGIGDFNGDHRDDILWRNDNGHITDWLGQTGGGWQGNIANADSDVTADWRVAGVGDFNGDGRDDVLWRSVDGLVVNWLGQANGGFAGNPAAFNDSSSTWHIVGVGDFNGDHRDDVLWRNDNGDVVNWLSQANGSFIGNMASYNNASTAWQIAGIGDFNGDGRADILWRGPEGTVTDWLGQADGSFAGNASNAFLNVGWDWQVIAVGDVNGDHRDDIVWRGSDGTVTDWLGQLNGGFAGNFINAHSDVSTAWNAQPVHCMLV